MSKYTGVDNLEVMKEAVNYNNHLSHIIRKYLKDGDRILDFGAGLGQFSIPLIADGYDVACVEADENMLRQVTEHGIIGFTDISITPDNGFDYIFSMNVLEHIKSDAATLQDISRKLRDNGRLLIYVPAFQLIYSSMDAKVGHFRRYRMADLNAKIKSAGLVVKQSCYVDSIGFIASLVFKYLGNKEGTISRSHLIVFDRFVFPLSLVLDFAVNKIFGKNLLVIAEKPRVSEHETVR